MKKCVLVHGALVLAIAALFTACVNVDAVVINNPDINSIADGVYRGSSRVGPVQVILDVTVENGAYTSIAIIRHFNGRGRSAEAILSAILDAQSLEVDVISGATGSSKAILKAIENALD